MLDDQNRRCKGRIHMSRVEDFPISLSLTLSSKDDRPYDGDYLPEFATTEDIDCVQYFIDMEQAQKHKSLRQRQQQRQTKASISQ